MRKPFLLSLLFIAITLLAAQDPYTPGPAWVFVLALAAGVVAALISLIFGILSFIS